MKMSGLHLKVHVSLNRVRSLCLLFPHMRQGRDWSWPQTELPTLWSFGKADVTKKMHLKVTCLTLNRCFHLLQVCLESWGEIQLFTVSGGGEMVAAMERGAWENLADRKSFHPTCSSPPPSGNRQVWLQTLVGDTAAWVMPGKFSINGFFHLLLKWKNKREWESKWIVFLLQRVHLINNAYRVCSNNCSFPIQHVRVSFDIHSLYF